MRLEEPHHNRMNADHYRAPMPPSKPERRKRSINFSLITIALVASVSFTMGYVTKDQNWIEPSAQNAANEALPDDLDFSSVEEVYDELRANYDGELTESELLDGLKKGLAEASGDAYTVFFNQDETNEFYNDLNGSFEGIGAELGKDGDLIIVVAPIKGFPADKAGLRPQDAIIEIDGEDVIGIEVEEAVTRIRGESGTDVMLTIVREGERLDITITRATITLPSVEYEIINDGKTGLLQIYRFADDTVTLAKEAAQEFKDAGVENVILDMRNNSGGLVTAAVGIASLWLEESQTVYEQKSGGVSEGVVKALGNPLLHDLPLVVLINQGSASASEIVAGALKDYDYGTVVGLTSFGKGSVQQLSELGDGSTLKVTVARWFTPNDVNIDETGIVPDVEIEPAESDFENGTDAQLDKAIDVLNKTQ